jgi:Sulfotransferase family
MRLLRTVEVGAKRISWAASRQVAAFLDPHAIAFYEQLRDSRCEPNHLLKALPTHKLIYIIVPKAASTRIRTTLRRVAADYSRSLRPTRWLKFGTRGLHSMTVSGFFRLATSPQTLKFSFVRNPYTRAVSCWADKFRGKPLVGGDPLIEMYLARRNEIDTRLPAGRDRTLSFEDFVIFATAIAGRCCESHLQSQADIISVPGIKLDLIGKVESFFRDFAHVLDHLHADASVRREAVMPLNQSSHADWHHYYTTELADRIYSAYERDFDMFGYTSAISD